MENEKDKRPLVDISAGDLVTDGHTSAWRVLTGKPDPDFATFATIAVSGSNGVVDLMLDQNEQNKLANPASSLSGLPNKPGDGLENLDKKKPPWG